MRDRKFGRWVACLACALGFGVVTFAATPASALTVSDVGTYKAGSIAAAQPESISAMSWDWN